MIRALLDSNAYDKVLEQQDTVLIEVAVSEQRLVLFASEIVEAELRRTPDAGKRQQLLDLFFHLGGTRLPFIASLQSADERLVRQAQACHALLVSDDRTLGATPYAEFRALLQA